MKHAGILGIPMDLGANIKGSSKGPDNIREFLIPLLEEKGIPHKDFGNIPIPYDHTETDPRKKNYGEIEHVCVNFLGYKEFIDSEFPLVLGGDHTASICFVRGLSSRGKTGIIYFDAHGDFNTPATTPSGNIHGMVVSEITSEKQGNVLHLICTECTEVDETNVVLIGTRELDEEEEVALERSDVTVFDMEKVRRYGIKKITENAFKIASKGTNQTHLSFDLDVADPSVTPAVSTPVPGGLLKEEVFESLNLLKGRVTSMDIVEYIPKRDINWMTGKFAAEIITSILRS